MQTFELKQEEFRKWLLSLPPDDIVGEASRCYACPIAKYLLAKTGALAASVSRVSYLLEFAEDEFSTSQVLPKWASKFIDQVDDLDYGEGVTGQEALTILDGLVFS